MIPPLIAILAVAALVDPALAQQPPDLRFVLTEDAAGKVGREDKQLLLLRPNLRRQVFLHLENKGGPAEVKVEVVAAGKVIASTKVNAAGPLTPVIFGKAQPPKDGKDSKDSKNGKPEPLPVVAGPLFIRALLEGDKQAFEPLLVHVDRPRRYAATEKETFIEDVLEFTVRADKEEFRGPPARVDLVLRPDRIPGLVPGQRKQGAYGGFLQLGKPLVLRAENLKFDTFPGKKDYPGLIYLTVDGYERAFTYFSYFRADATTEATPRKFTKPILRLVHAPYAKPGEKLKVTVEADNLDQAIGELALYRDKDLTERESDVFVIPDDRKIRMAFSSAGIDGALVFEPKVSDWTFEIDTEGLFGKRYLGLRLLDQQAEKEFVNGLFVRRDKGTLDFETTKRVVGELLLSDSPPDMIVLDVDLEAAPGELPRLLVGDPLKLKATALDPTGIRKAVFFAGPPPADGKFLPTTPHAEGERLPGPDEVWVAQLNAPTDKKATLTVGVQMTNGVGTTATKTIKVELVDPSGKGGPEKTLATVTGKVVEGSRAIAGVPVTIADDKGAVKGAGTTDAKGEFKFENVPPGSYVVTAVRSASRTRGQSLVAVPEGKKTVAVGEVKLTR